MGEAAKNTTAGVVASGESERSRARFPTYLTIVDGKTVEREHDPNEERIDDLHAALSKMENDPRWMKVHSHTMVLWEGHWTTWQSLSGNERTCCYFDSDGTLKGEFPI